MLMIYLHTEQILYVRLQCLGVENILPDLLAKI
jgi:hypothetical protein